MSTKANFQMQNFLLLAPIQSELDKTYRNFFWNKSPESGLANLVRWDKICVPKRFGGLGFRKAHVNNVALQMKLLWKIIDYPSNL